MAAGETAIHRPICPDGRTVRDGPAAFPCPERSRPFVLAATIIASAMAFIDGSVVTIALPAMQADLRAGFGALQWVVNAYALLLGGLILVGGAAGDRIGRRRVFVLGIALFAASSLACAAAPSIGALVAARAVQGVGAALLVPQSLAILSASFPREVRGRAIGIWAGASAITTALGPPLGGFLVDALDWRAVFWINLPLSALAIRLAVRHVPESRDESATGGLDLLGGGLAVAAFGLLTVGVTLLAERSGTVAFAAAFLIAGLAGLALFLRTEARAESPLLPLALFGDRVFAGANAITLFLYGALAGVFFLLPFELIGRRGLSATEAGLTLLPFGIIVGTLSRFAGDWADRAGPRSPLVLGSLVFSAAATALALNVEGYWLGVLAPVIALSVGMAIVVAPLTTAVMNAAPDAQSGAASGVNNAASRLAGLFAVAILAALATAVFRAGLEGGTAASLDLRFGVLPAPGAAERSAAEASFLGAYRASMGVAAAWSALAALLAAVMIPVNRPG